MFILCVSSSWATSSLARWKESFVKGENLYFFLLEWRRLIISSLAWEIVIEAFIMLLCLSRRSRLAFFAYSPFMTCIGYGVCELWGNVCAANVKAFEVSDSSRSIQSAHYSRLFLSLFPPTAVQRDPFSDNLPNFSPSEDALMPTHRWKQWEISFFSIHFPFSLSRWDTHIIAEIFVSAREQNLKMFSFFRFSLH